MSAKAAVKLLDVKRETLYAYVSRGLVRSLAGDRGRVRRYALQDLLRLKARRDARRGHTAVAATALDFGAPVLDSAITRIDADGPHYRGHSALELVRAGASFERVANLLWSGQDAAIDEPATQASWVRIARAVTQVVPKQAPPLSVLVAGTLLAGLYDPDRHAANHNAELRRARELQRALAALLALARNDRSAQPREGESIAEILCRTFAAEEAPQSARSVDQMLVLCADHELNVSAFAVRVTASTGADLYACLSAGLCALSGPWHGGMCDRVEAMARACDRPANARALVRERARLGEYIPGFGHPLYPAGDPRGQFLWARAHERAARKPELKVMRAIAEAMADRGHAPTLDFGLVALSMALGLPVGSATAIFALGRTAGWVAHALEQRTKKALLRPRARYVGPDAVELNAR